METIDEYDVEDVKDVENPEKPEAWEYVRSHARDWVRLKHGVDEPYGTDAAARSRSEANETFERRKKRVRLAMDIRTTLKECREPLIQESTLLNMQQPSQQSMAALSNYFHIHITSSTESEPHRSTYPILSGASSYLYPHNMDSSRIRFPDYVSVSRRSESDLLTYFLKTYCSRLFETRPPVALPQEVGISHLPRHQVVHYSIAMVRFVASFVTTLTATLLLFLPIYTLYNISTSRAALTLGLIAMFTVLFACGIVVLINARRAEVFGACAACAAVLVVFVSGDFSGTGS
ncbi:hypothetical protein PFICI_02182 [Pestalotiopsis fici W106-1]|uniref:DUF6594 domain-containing protein n=1 Tax=Pestalotiopsis fici (strain W106-1 / CGMCC3.15140) TaxID=1229662 RepID=W3XFE9_PESFW|nr:uncharacterized protein PFICI_02182 [Pestalotiopsis fici W106-1]ETS84157.1 hypothetical protein PFICI_02182 [Pestalotiopsis fici W106-1]